MICLSSDELCDLTCRRRPTAQVRVLRALGIDHKVRPDGTVLVLRDVLQTGLATAKLLPVEKFAVNRRS